MKKPFSLIGLSNGILMPTNIHLQQFVQLGFPIWIKITMFLVLTHLCLLNCQFCLEQDRGNQNKLACLTFILLQMSTDKLKRLQIYRSFYLQSKKNGICVCQNTCLKRKRKTNQLLIYCCCDVNCSSSVLAMLFRKKVKQICEHVN